MGKILDVFNFVEKEVKGGGEWLLAGMGGYGLRYDSRLIWLFMV